MTQVFVRSGTFRISQTEVWGEGGRREGVSSKVRTQTYYFGQFYPNLHVNEIKNAVGQFLG